MSRPMINASLGHVGTARGRPRWPATPTARPATASVRRPATASGSACCGPHAGRLGAVFVALDTELHREVRAQANPRSARRRPRQPPRFLLEAEVTGGLEHPGIVPVYGLGAYDGGRPYYAMRFIRGDSLKEAIDRFHADPELKADAGRRSLELRKLLRRFIDVCNAIAYAHSRGVLHRDIKPGNIMLGRYGETLVVDWGLAKVVGQGPTRRAIGEQTLLPIPRRRLDRDGAGLGAGHAGLHEPGAGRGRPGATSGRERRLQPGRHPLLPADRQAALRGCDVGDVIRRVQRGDFHRRGRSIRAIDRALEAVCLKAMAFRPGRTLRDGPVRWPTTSSAGWPTSRCRPGASLGRCGRGGGFDRHQAAATGVAAAVVVAVAGLMAVSVVQAEANRGTSRFQQP